MKILHSISFAALVVILSGCSGPFTEHRDWRFVQSVGGMAIGQPQRKSSSRYSLPVECNVSGLRAITVPPTTINSVLMCAGFDVRKDGSDVYLTLRTSLFGRSSQCKAISLGRLIPGTYSVYYRDPNGTSHSLGTFTIEG